MTAAATESAPRSLLPAALAEDGSVPEPAHGECSQRVPVQATKDGEIDAYWASPDISPRTLETSGESTISPLVSVVYVLH